MPLPRYDPAVLKTLLRQLWSPRARAAGSIDEATALMGAGRLSEAETMLRALCAHQPDDPQARVLFGRVLYLMGRAGAAAAALQQAVELVPNDTDALYLLGRARTDIGEYDAAAEALRRLTQLDRSFGRGWLALADAIAATGDLDAAEAHYLRAVSLAPDEKTAPYNYAILLENTARADDAAKYYRQALKIDPDFVRAHSNLLFVLNRTERIAPPALFREHVAWARRHAEHITAAADPQPPARSKERLKIGYVSPNFRDHAVTYFFEPVLRHHDARAFDVYCYSDTTSPDHRTERLRATGCTWRETAEDSHAQLAARVRADGVDILVDLSGHTRGDRLLAFARKPAPLQITWNGYPNTTGMSAIDYRITDGYADPPGMTEHLHTERLLRMPEIYMPFEKPDDDVAIGPPPREARGAPTFGAFNVAPKLTPRMLRLWARILERAPGSRLLMLALPEGATRERLAAAFKSRGIARDRLDLRGRVPHVEFLRTHNEVDVALDTFPYHGTTTTAHTLWMGVPVVTLAGATHASRVGVSMLSNAGLPELVAESDDDYVGKAVAIANDVDRLRELRATLRTRLAASPNMDGPRFTRHLEEAYRRIWDDYVRSPHVPGS